MEMEECQVWHYHQVINIWVEIKKERDQFLEQNLMIMEDHHGQMNIMETMGNEERLWIRWDDGIMVNLGKFKIYII